mgnify:CR=1 FL=1
MNGLLTSLMLCAPAASACDIALMLAVDVSGSVDGREYRIQMDGLAAALTDRSVMGAFVASQAQIALMQWTGTGRQTVVINWTKITNTDDVHAFAFEVATVPRIWRDFQRQSAKRWRWPASYTHPTLPTKMRV